MHDYVLGFAFNEAKDKVLTVLKQKGPSVNIGKINGVGGKIDPKELAINAMIREFGEETGGLANWTQIGYTDGPFGDCWLFSGEIVVDSTVKKNDVGEPIQWVDIKDILNPENKDIYAQNLPTILSHILSGHGYLIIHMT